MIRSLTDMNARLLGQMVAVADWPLRVIPANQTPPMADTTLN